MVNKRTRKDLSRMSVEELRQHRAEISRRSAAKKRTEVKRLNAERAEAESNTWTWPKDPGGAVADWSRRSLKVPPGHKNAGQPLNLPDYLIAPIRSRFQFRETSLVIARKCGKSSAVAVLLLAHLVGPLRALGFRAGVVSISKEKAGELKKLMEAIAEASGLEGLKFYRSPTPGRVASSAGEVDILSSDSNAGAASGYDLGIFDELGLFTERDRDLVNGVRSSTSARDGVIVSMSVYGSGPFIPEILDRHKKGDPDLAVHIHQPKNKSCALDDKAAWHEANPGLAAGIKSLDYMRAESRRVRITTADQPSFRAFDLNLPSDPSREMLVSLADWNRCLVDPLPERSGPCVVGFDAGDSASMTAAVVIWRSGRFEVYGAFPSVPPLKDRAEADNAPYLEMEKEGTLTLYDGRVTPVGAFLESLAERLRANHVQAFGADRFRRADVLQGMESAEIRWPVVWRGTGHSSTADGSYDVRAFQDLAQTQTLGHAGPLMMATALRGCHLIRDPSGNPKLDKSKQKSRIDPAQAGVIAAGLFKARLESRPAGRPIRSCVVNAETVAAMEASHGR